MILESLVTTRDPDGLVNIAPMGPRVDESINVITLKPFRSSKTFDNLRTNPFSVVHVTDNVELLAATAIGRVDAKPMVEPVLGHWSKLIDCCRWFAVEVIQWSEDPASGESMRLEARCKIVHRGEQRPMFGLSRAKHAVVEAAIILTRIDLIGRDEVRKQMQPLRSLVQKTGGASERLAWQRMEAFVDG